MTVFAGRNPMMKNSFKRSSVMVEGTQLQMVGVLDSMICKELKKSNRPVQFNDEINS